MIPKFRMWNRITSQLHLVDGLYFDDGEVEYVDNDDVIRFVSFKNIELMQSTELKDKNGKEIFEGDIVSVGTATRVVKKNNLLGFYIEEGEKIGYFSSVVDVNCLDLFVKDFGEEAEILSNIYENKELLDA